MYSNNITLTNKLGINFALSNKFTDIPLMKMEIEECISPEEVKAIANKYALYGKWTVKMEGRSQLLLESVEQPLNNVYYLVVKNVINY